MVNILLLLLVAIIVFKNLFSGFGYLTEEDMKKKKEAVKSFLKKVNDTTEKQDKTNTTVVEPKDFKEDVFLREAEKTVEAVTEAFNNGKLDNLAKLVENNVFNNFSKQLSKNLIDKQTMHTILVAFTEKTILNKVLDGKKPYITVKFVMNQINYVENAMQEVVAGSKSKVEKIEEIWTFTKTDTQEQNWRVQSIEGVK